MKSKIEELEQTRTEIKQLCKDATNLAKLAIKLKLVVDLLEEDSGNLDKDKARDIIDDL
ncbi:hypothetical protein SAMN02910292_03022 [Lachnospiraceae bacterium XBB2008]|nr:hypothetical protein SAMN02910292_03022 [Lachnospiraceae bacterium XBB2008]